MVSIQARIDAFAQKIEEEIRLTEAALAKSSTARTASASVLSIAKPVPSVAGDASSLPAFPDKNDVKPTKVASPFDATAPLQSPSAALQIRTRSPSVLSPIAGSSPAAVAPAATNHKEGPLLHLTRSGGLFGARGTHTFAQHYVVVSANSGISWYASREDFLHQPHRPLGRAAFWIETYNSRGSRFKKAAVCWPLILPEDCPAATDSTKTYFAVEYYTSNGEREQLVLAADSPEERDAWVQHLTKYIELYLAPRAESEELQHITRGATTPVHRSGVIEGEAPGGTVL
ncbi:hypothetical protein ABL78_5064 [Leptomonas seymouri]|uniref:PH domain-containing protein n=1 Tax=Leptomonas seymouri TaxID=5684 RepID=A0A0N1PBT8_LEPSE|nr:hypothetical protein ABL78_5064 [Leptomonas seymouri]|eukprot:KPI85883.1 hypothetical protein ABL78_5064 [Leptomonas seymouri]